VKAFLVVCMAVIVMASAATAEAFRRPTPSERVAIMKTVRVYVDTSDCCAVISRIKVLGIRVSTVNRRWAMVYLDGYDESGREVGAVDATLHKGNLTGRWSVRNFGTGGQGCGVPLAVRRDLRITC
jgi:hypothetical protein